MISHASPKKIKTFSQLSSFLSKLTSELALKLIHINFDLVCMGLETLQCATITPHFQSYFYISMYFLKQHILFLVPILILVWIDIEKYNRLNRLNIRNSFSYSSGS
jgi:hypothetical protein